MWKEKLKDDQDALIRWNDSNVIGQSVKNLEC